MTYSKADLPHIKWGLLTFLLVLVAGGVIIVASENLSPNHNSISAMRNANWMTRAGSSLPPGKTMKTCRLTRWNMTPC